MPTSNDSGPAATTPPQRFRSFDGLYFRLGGSRQLAYCPLTGEARVLTNAAAQLLQGCRTAATLNEHAEVLGRQFGFEPAQVQSARAELAELAASGLLVPESTLFERCRADTVDDVAPPPISSLGIPTRNRPSHLHRSLEGFAASSCRLGRPIRFVVADGSDELQACADNEHALAELKGELGCDITYIGAEEKAAFARLLSERAQVAPDIVRFAMLNDERCPIATGGNRNALLLATLDELTLQVDDDAECVLAPGPAMRGGVTLTSEYDPTELWFDDTARMEAQADQPESDDFFARHEQLLGKSLASCLRGIADADVDTGRMAMSFLRRLKGRRGKVHVSAVGSAGDLGTGSEFSFLRLDGAARVRLVRSADDYRRTIASHVGVRAVGSATISDGAFCSGLNLGLDNREPLPPFMPVQRNQDGIFAQAVRATGDGYFGHLPWTIRHWRPQRWRDAPHAAAGVRSGTIIEALVGSFRQTGSAGAEKNLADLGSLLVEVSTQPARDFQEVVAQMAWGLAAQRSHWLAQLLARHKHQPEFWARDVAAYLSTLREALPRENYAAPSDLTAAFGPEAAALLMQRLVLNYGRLLQAWTHLRRTALELRLQGYEIGRRI